MTLVAGELDMGILQELSTKHVCESVILLVQSEDRGVGGACEQESGMIASEGRV